MLPRTWKRAARARLAAWRTWFARTFQSYDRAELLQALRRLGIASGDTVMLHSAWSQAHGFSGSIDELIDTFVESVGPQGHLLMVSLPFGGASIDWLERGRTFDVRRTPSMMGMISEKFRRRADVHRSLHPTHPILVHGPQPERFIASHPDSVYPCGPDTPFGAMVHADARVVFLNVPIDVFTFFHYLEHMVSPTLPFALYTEHTFDAPVVDVDGRTRTVRTHAFAREAIRRRRPERLYDALRAGGFVAAHKIGASRLLSVRVRDAIACTQALQAEGRLFYDMTP